MNPRTLLAGFLGALAIVRMAVCSDERNRRTPEAI